MYRDYQGEILYNGTELRDFPQREWFQIFSCVFQDFARYYLFVEENIGLGGGGGSKDLEVDKKRIKEIAEKLGIHGSIVSLEHSYEIRLGKLDEGSVDFSGGQWQRLAMGRALMNDTPLLLLDEPTAALDPISESNLYEQFGEISKNRTSIFISHRPGFIKLADHIYVLQDG